MEKLKEKIGSNYVTLITIVFLVTIFFVFIGIPLQDSRIVYNNIRKIYFADDITESHKAVITKFNKINEGRIQVIPINLPFEKFTTNERKELLARSFRSKNDKIDVFSVDLIWVPRFAKWAEPLGKYFNKEKTDKILNYALESCYYNNELVAVPLKLDIGTMIYRKDLIGNYSINDDFENKLSASISWEDLIKFGNSNTNNKAPLYLFPAKNYEGLVCSFVEGILNLNRDFFKNPHYKLNSQEPKKVLTLLSDLVNKYKLTPPVVCNYNELLSCKYFVKNDGLLIRYWPEFMIDYNLFYKDSSKSPQFERAPLPHFEGHEPASIFGGWNLMISRFSNNKDAALEFVRFLISEESQNIFLQQGDALPVIKSIYDNSTKSSKKDFLEYYKKLMKSGVHRPYWEDYTRISDIIAYFANKAISGEIGVTEALISMDKMISSDKIIIR